MQSQRGVSLFVVLLVVIAAIGAALFGLPWYNNKRELARVEKKEADAMRGVPPSSQPEQTSGRPSARELANKLEAEEAMRGGSATPAPSSVPPAAAVVARSPAESAGGELLTSANDFKSLIEPSYYNALSAPCKVLLDTVLKMLDNPENSSSFREKLDAAERRFMESCRDK